MEEKETPKKLTTVKGKKVNYVEDNSDNKKPLKGVDAKIQKSLLESKLHVENESDDNNDEVIPKGRKTKTKQTRSKKKRKKKNLRQNK